MLYKVETFNSCRNYIEIKHESQSANLYNYYDFNLRVANCQIEWSINLTE